MFIDTVFVNLSFLFLYVYFCVYSKNFLYAYNHPTLDFWSVLPSSMIVVTVYLFEFNINTTLYLDNNVYESNILYAKAYIDDTMQNSYIISLFATTSFYFSLTLTKPLQISKKIVLHIILINALSLMFIFSSPSILLFISFELLLLVALSLLKLTSKSERIMEAVGEMFIWTLFGSLFLFLAISINFNFYNTFLDYFNENNLISTLIGLFFVIGFGVKVPIWPCLSWLLKAHVEASVEFSILLSGFIVKLGILGLSRIFDNFSNPSILSLLFVLSLLAILDSTIRLLSQQDLKKIVALTTVIEMNWLLTCLILGDTQSLFIANFLIVVHTFSTTSEFLLVECLSKRFNTRDIWSIGSVWYNTPNLWYVSLFVIFITIGFPGTSIFIAKFLFLPVIFSVSILLFVFFMLTFLLIIPLFFVKLWLPIWFGLYNKPNQLYFDISQREFSVFIITISINILLGLYPNLFFVCT